MLPPRFAALVFVATLLCAAPQDPGAKKPDTLQIRGTVIEFGTPNGIEEVDVTLERLADEGPRFVSPAIPKNIIGSTKTDTSGAFVFEIEKSGDYRVTIFKEGYNLPGAFTQGFSTNATVTLDNTHPRREVKFQLARPGEISGRVVDEETKEPVASLRVLVLEHRYSRGRLLGFPGGSATTDADGRFVARGLAPGEYVASLGPRMQPGVALKAMPELQKYGEDLLMQEFSEDDLKKVDRDYEQTYWPGGSSLSAAFPVSVGSGGSVNMGQLTVKKVPVYRVRVSLQCTPGAVAGVDVRGPRLGTTIGSVPCGKDFLMRGFAPGAYRLEVCRRSARSRAQTARRDLCRSTIVDKNIEIFVPVTRGVDIDGKVVLAEGAGKPELAKVQLRLSPISWVSFLGDEQNPIDAQGKFRIVNTAIRDQQLYVSGLPAPHYVKEVRYNGHRISDNIVQMDAGAPSHSLEIVVDDKPATVMGAVTDRDKPVSQPTVVLARWPLNTIDVFFSVVMATGDENGKFSFTAIGAGRLPGLRRGLGRQRQARRARRDGAPSERSGEAEPDREGGPERRAQARCALIRASW